MTPPSPDDPARAPVHGSSSIEPVRAKGSRWWLWLLPLLLLLAVLLFAMRSCGDDDDAVRAPARSAPVSDAGGTPAVGVKQVTLPGGTVLDLEASSFNYLLQEYLASSAPAPRTFVFDHLNFATASSELPGDAQATVTALAEILKAYPSAKVRLDGYADARGTEPANAELGAKRAQAVAAALTSLGIAADRVATATGGESNPVETNATAGGRAENRRTELVVLSK